MDYSQIPIGVHHYYISVSGIKEYRGSGTKSHYVTLSQMNPGEQVQAWLYNMGNWL